MFSDIRQHSLDLVLGADHVGAFRHVTLQADRIEHTLGSAQAAADTFVLIHHAHTAAQTTAGFRFDLILCKCETIVLEAACLLRIMHDRLTSRGIKAIAGKSNIVLIQLIELAEVTTDGEALAFLNEAVQRLCTLASGRNSIDSELGSGVYIASDEDVLLLGLVSDGVGQGVTLFTRLQFANIQRAPVNGLTNSSEDRIDLDGLELAGADRCAATFLIALAQLHKLDLQAGNLTVLSQNLDGTIQEAELHTFGAGFGDFFLIGGHLVFAAAIDYIGFRTETDSRAADIHRNIAAADYGALLADFRGISEVDFAQEVNAAIHALQILAGDTELRALLCTDCDIETLIALLTQLFDGDILTDLGVHLEVNSHLLENLNLAIEGTAIQTITGNAHNEHATRLRIAIKHCDIDIAHERKIICTAETGRSGADDSDLFLIRLIYGTAADQLGYIALIRIQILFCNEFFDFINGDSLIQFTAGSGILTAAIADVTAD